MGVHNFFMAALFRIIRIVSVLFTAISLFSCISSSTYIKTASVSGPAQNHMIRITDKQESESHTMRLQYIENLDQEIHTSASEVNTVYSNYDEKPYFELRDNVIWKLPKRELLFDLEFPLSKVVVIYGGLNVGQVEEKTHIGKIIGFGFRGTGGDLRMRLDLSLNIQDINYEVAYMNETTFFGGSRDTTTIYDHGTFASTDVGIGITLNTANQEWVLNPFIHGGIGSQEIIQAKETSLFPDPPSYSDSYLNLSAGFFFRIGGNHRLLIGYGMNRHSNDNGKAPWTSKLILQTDFVF